jgi:hypothetical protein
MKSIICTLIASAALVFVALILTQQQPGRWQLGKFTGLNSKLDTYTGHLHVFIPADETTGVKTGFWMMMTAPTFSSSMISKDSSGQIHIAGMDPQLASVPPAAQAFIGSTNPNTLIPTWPAIANQTRRATKSNP